MNTLLVLTLLVAFFAPITATPAQAAVVSEVEARLGTLTVRDWLGAESRSDGFVLSYTPPTAKPESNNTEIRYQDGTTITVPFSNVECGSEQCVATISVPVRTNLLWSFSSHTTQVVIDSTRISFDDDRLIPMCGCWPGPLVFRVPNIVGEMHPFFFRLGLHAQSADPDGPFMTVMLDDKHHFLARAYYNNSEYRVGQNQGVGYELMKRMQVTTGGGNFFASFKLAGVTGPGWRDANGAFVDFGSTSSVIAEPDDRMAIIGGNPTKPLTLTKGVTNIDLVGEYSYWNDAVQSIDVAFGQLQQPVPTPSPSPAPPTPTPTPSQTATPGPTTLQVGTNVWRDLNRDGLYNDGLNAGVDGVVVSAYQVVDDRDQFVTSTVTTDGGFYDLGLPVNKVYRLKFSGFDPNLTFTQKSAGKDPRYDSDVNPSGYTDYFFLGNALGGDRFDLDAGLIALQQPTPAPTNIPYYMPVVLDNS